ncbi:MAG: aminotransferase class I/II-fold pyridoxal phosphate-dependent enzyme [Saccharofermentans sp.]|nr:aminotransferase class I/II-fold pyridoxal phosphate-dependent enzyme [Saccharofermentans sp.]
MSGADITEIEGFDNLHDPQGIIMELETELASLWNAKEAFISVNGATAAIEAAICAAMRYYPDGRILAASNCHLSVWHGIEMSGCAHRIVNPSAGNLPFPLEICPADIEKTLREDSSIRTVVITSPTYEGVISDTKTLFEITRRYNCTLIVDEAHGSHLGLDDFWGEGSVGDIVIKSTHKTLSSPTQTAVMLKNTDRISTENIRHYIDVFESTSPSYILLSGISEMAELLGKGSSMDDWKKAVLYAENKLKYLTNIRLFSAENKDRSKLILLCDGSRLAGILREQFNIEAEAFWDTHLIAMTGIGDNEETIKRFTDAVRKIDAEHPELITDNSPLGSFEHFPVMSLAEAARIQPETVPVSEAEGQICGEFIYKYPPGVPVLMPGEMITEKALTVLLQEKHQEIRILRSQNPSGQDNQQS